MIASLIRLGETSLAVGLIPSPWDKLAHAGQEVGDIVLYLLLLCSELGLDMDQVVRAKLADSERRFAR